MYQIIYTIIARSIRNLWKEKKFQAKEKFFFPASSNSRNQVCEDWNFYVWVVAGSFFTYTHKNVLHHSIRWCWLYSFLNRIHFDRCLSQYRDQNAHRILFFFFSFLSLLFLFHIFPLWEFVNHVSIGFHEVNRLVCVCVCVSSDRKSGAKNKTIRVNWTMLKKEFTECTQAYTPREWPKWVTI